MRDEKPAIQKTTIDKDAMSCYSLANAGLTSKPPASPGQVIPIQHPAKVSGGHTQENCVPGMSQTETLNLWQIWRECDRRIDSLAQSVREGVQVDEASNFGRWLRFSGILTLLQPFEQEVPLPIRASELSRKCEDLIYECGEWYRSHERSNKPRDAYISASKLAAIEDDLRAIKDALRLPSMATTDTVNATATGLHVMPGGAV